MSLVSRVFSNRYEIRREIAQGGMAEVYLAHDVLLDRPVALKALFPEYAREPSFVERFRREAQAAAQLNHPNIVAIYDWGQESGTYFIVLEYVEGRTLRDLLRGDGPIEAHQAADIAAEIASALAFAHRSGVVHRDVKPGNVLITPSGGVKVTDFGIARAGTADGLTQTGSVMGTATYFSPEQAQGLAVDGRSDVYSLGVVLYEMVTGVAPFTGDSPVAVAYKHVREEPLPPTRRNPEVPAELEQIILTAMAKDVDLRYQSADDLRADLLRFRRGRPLAAAPVTAIVADMTDDAVPAAAATAAVTAAARPAGPEGTRAGPAVAPPPRRRRRALATVLTLLVLVVLVGLIVVVSGLAGEGDGQVEVPEVEGLDVRVARERLEDLGLEVRVRPVPNDEVKENLVIRQDPGPGTNVDRGDTVRLTVSAGAAEVEIPNLVGQSADEARATLEAAGLVFKAEFEESEEVAVGDVIRTDPEAGTRVAEGFEVLVYVSAGPAPVPVPNVLNMDDVEAAAVLGEAGFRVQRLVEPSDTVDVDKVIRTEPGANEEAPRGSTVRMYVSSGPELFEVPSVVGQTESDALATLAEAGFEGSVVYASSSEANDGRVIDQSPGAGAQEEQGSVVVITVGEFTPATTTTTSAPATTTTTTAP